MKRGTVFLCDSDRVYLGRLHGYLRERIRMPLEWLDFTDVSYLPAHTDHPERTVLVIAERDALRADLTSFGNILLLTEQSSRGEYGCIPRTEKHTDIRTVSRYSRASEIADRLLELLGDVITFPADEADGNCRTTVIGYYSPLGRCMQTSAAIAAGQLLSARSRALFIGFDAFPVTALNAEDTGADLSDLLYYFGCDRSKLNVWIQRAKKRMGMLEYIPPAASIHRTQGVDGAEWVAMIRAICAQETPDYLLLDLSGQTPGLFDILSACHTVYTITGHDAQDAAKIEGYKRWLVESGSEDILQKTVFCKMPKGCRLPARAEMLGGSTLAAHLVKNGLVPGERMPRGTHRKERSAVVV
ncbi:MAG: hypothetical protein IJQ21_08920 [Lachnospiraceae bacterium]|nr:hypothetical protein [Lachnospiraceae bacterium]